jgi:hypothetical protein
MLIGKEKLDPRRSFDVKKVCHNDVMNNDKGDKKMRRLVIALMIYPVLTENEEKQVTNVSARYRPYS